MTTYRSFRPHIWTIALLLTVEGLVPHTVTAQASDTLATQAAVPLASDAFVDATAEALFRSARANWLSIDESVVRYTALIQQRIAAAIRTPLKDRTLYRSELAVRAFWDRDYDAIVQVLGSRIQHPGIEPLDEREPWEWLNDLPFDEPFQPGGDRLFFGFTDADEEAFTPSNEDFWFAHPLARGADTLYRYESGDTLTLSFPDGRRLRAVQLNVLPRVADVHRITGTLWIEPESGALARAVYRLSQQFDVIRDVPEVQQEEEAGEFDMVPGIFKPWTFDLTVVGINYSLWDFKVWLPHSMRVEGEAAAGIMKFPISMDVSYRIESVTTEDDLAEEEAEGPPDDIEERHFESRAEAMAFLAQLLRDPDGVEYRPVSQSTTITQDGDTVIVEYHDSRFLVPTDVRILENSPHIPPPIWDDAPGFASEDELQEMVETMADLPAAPVQGIPWQLNWGWARHDLLRYNRVEGLAAGGRFESELGFLEPLTFQASGFFGLADLEPKARIGFERASVKRRITLGGYREIQATDPRGRYLGVGNSLHALLFGRDDGEYFLATGADLMWRPPEPQRQSFKFRAYAERQDPVVNKIDFALYRSGGGSDVFRPNVPAELVEEAGAELTVSPWWGPDPLSAQVGLELYGHAAAWRTPDSTATHDYARARAVLRIAFPLADAAWRVGIETGAGTTWGDAPLQRSWFLGGPLNLRGYTASTMMGPSFTRGRLEVARVMAKYATTISAFGDVGWAGVREDFDTDDLLYGVGVGASLMDGLIRFDISQGLRGPGKYFRVDLYLDAIL